MNEPGEIAVALRGSLLSGLPVEEDVGGAFIIDEIDPEQILPSWQAARALVPVTGRWPVMIGPEEVYGDPTPDELADMRRVATSGHPWSVFRPGYGDEPVPEWRLTSSLPSVLGDELVARAMRELPAPVTEAALGRWVYDRMLEDPGLATRAVRILGDFRGTKQWYQPRQVQLALLPTPLQWLAPAWLRYFGAGDPVRWRALAGALYEWERRCGAELVAWWGTMLQFVVSRPPAAGDPAWEVAGQLKAVGGSLQMEQWTLALGVARSDAWFLHDRP